MGKYVYWIFAILFFIAISAFFHFYFEKEGDGDIFYHFRHAEIYAEKGIFYNEFPWLPQTIIGQNNSDQWYGFHLLLTPFTLFEDRIFGIKLAGIFITTAFLSLFYFSLKILKTGKDFFWTIFMFFSVPPTLFHLLLIRPHALSTGLGVLLFAILVSGYGYTAIFAVSFFLTWFHPNLFWLAILIIGTTFFLQFYRERTLSLQKCFVALCGILIGLFLTPQPIGTFKTIFTVVFGSPLASISGVRLNAGTELAPLALKDFWIFGLFVFAWCAAMILASKQWSSKHLWASAVLSIIFFLMSVFLVRRSMDLWIVFGVILCAIVFKEKIEPNYLKHEEKVAINSLTYACMIILVAVGIYMYSIRIEQLRADIKDFQAAANWLSANSKNDEVVLNILWDQFPYLFFWNAKNHYTSGTDPFVLYAYDRELFQKSEELRSGNISNARNILADFNTRFLFVTQNESELLTRLSRDHNFEIAYQDGRNAIFKLKENQ